MAFSRAERKGVAKKVKKMSDTEVYSMIELACANYGDELVVAALESLKREFGFGEKRLQRFIDTMHVILKEESDDDGFTENA